MRKPCRRSNSGQLLTVAALAIAVLISSTTMYVYDLSKDTNNTDTLPVGDFVFVLRQSTKNTIISSLANVSNGGATTALTTNLAELSTLLKETQHFGICNLAYTVHNDSSYNLGTRLSWNVPSTGSSSAFANFTLQIYGLTAKVVSEYSINITTSLTVNGSYVTLGNGEKNVSLTCRLYNEGQPSLVKNLTVFYANGGNWTKVETSNNLSVTDYGNGTYHASFTVAVAEPLQVSVHAVDLRDVFVRADTTCPAA
jgi:hypothetical protein